MDLQEIAEAIGIPVLDWPGRCFEIAHKMVAHGLVEGTAVYGHWTGDVCPEAPVFGPRHYHPFQQHGWIALDDGKGTVVDPTRWVFENTAPYVFVGAPEDESWPYDEGGNKFRLRFMPTCPLYGEGPPFIVEVPNSILKGVCEAHIGHKQPWSPVQVVWLCNLPPEMFMGMAREFYEAIEKTGFSSFIPLDNLLMVKRGACR